MSDDVKALTLWKSQSETLEAAATILAIQTGIIPRMRRLARCQAALDVLSMATGAWFVMGACGMVAPWHPGILLAVCLAAGVGGMLAGVYRGLLDACVRDMAIEPSDGTLEEFEGMVDKVVRARRARREITYARNAAGHGD